MESLYLLFLAGLIFVAIFPFSFSTKFCFDFVENHGSLLLKLHFFKLLVAKLKRKGINIEVETKKKNEFVDLKFGEKQLRFLNFLQREVADKIVVSRLNVYGVVGAGDPFKGALASSLFSNSIFVVLEKMKLKKTYVKTNFRNKTDFFNLRFCIGITAKISLSLFDVFYSFFVSILRYKNERKRLT